MIEKNSFVHQGPHYYINRPCVLDSSMQLMRIVFSVICDLNKLKY